jgi:hypothetical protein
MTCASRWWICRRTALLSVEALLVGDLLQGLASVIKLPRIDADLGAQMNQGLEDEEPPLLEEPDNPVDTAFARLLRFSPTVNRP